MDMIKDSEQKKVIQNMERLYAKIHKLRDVINSNDWNNNLIEAYDEANEAMAKLSISINFLK